MQQERKIVVIGAGAVGATYCYALMQTSLANQIIIIDLDKERVEGEVMDLSHGLAFTPPVEIRQGDYADCEGADLIVLTAGAKQRSGESRLDLVQRNSEIIGSICEQIQTYTQDAVLLVATNPVDLMTYVAIKKLSWPRGQIMGSGTVLDTSRFRYMISNHCKIDPRNVHAYILGEHGDSEIAAWSMSYIGGIQIKEHCRRCKRCKDFESELDKIVQEVKDSAYHIIDYKGATYYAIGLSMVRISEAVLRNENSVLTVSSLLEGEYGINDTCLSVPCVVGGKGVTAIFEAELTGSEQRGLTASAKTLRDTLDQLKI